MKKIKELCLKELTKLDNDQLLSIITDTQEEEKEKEKGEGEREEEERERDIEVEERSKQDTFTTSSAQDQSLSEVEEGEVSPRYDHTQSPTLSPPSILISDISDEEYKTQTSHDQSHDQVTEYDKGQSLDEDQTSLGIRMDIKDDNVHLEEVTKDSKREEEGEGETLKEVHDDFDDDDDDGWSKDVSEQQKLLEMKMRKRLLENQVKRLQEKPQLKPEATDPHQNMKKQDYPTEVKRGEGTDDISGDRLKALEMRMREKALKSLLAKKGRSV